MNKVELSAKIFYYETNNARKYVTLCIECCSNCENGV